VTDDGLCLFAHKAVQNLRDMLCRTRLVHAERSAHDDEEQQQRENDHDLHRYRIGDGRLGILRVQVKERQQRIGHAGKVVVQEGCEWEQDWHSVRVLRFL
jgi:hypothetical protein